MYRYMTGSCLNQSAAATSSTIGVVHSFNVTCHHVPVLLQLTSALRSHCLSQTRAKRDLCKHTLSAENIRQRPDEGMQLSGIRGSTLELLVIAQERAKLTEICMSKRTLTGN